ncbi:MAG: PQQ-binding-like beta-propeller repeat protein [Thermogutta sp.]|nr:PQQ-binding-like beta-propeller repeat protein [Thermogutta sp.]
MATLRLPWLVLIAAVIGASGQVPRTAAAADLITHLQARAHGLTTPWFNVAGIDAGSGRLKYVLLDRGTVFALSSRSVLTAIDAETGKTLWTVQVGDPQLLSLKPTTGTHLIAVTNGSTIYVVNRYTGEILWKRELEGTPGAGPAISPSRVYVPRPGGKIESYAFQWETPEMQTYAWQSVPADAGDSETPVETAASATNEPAVPPAAPVADAVAPEVAAAQQAAEAVAAAAAADLTGARLRLAQTKDRGLYLQSFGRIYIEPIITHSDRGTERVAWPTDRGFLFVGEINLRSADRFSLVYQLRATAEIVAPPCVRFGDASKGIPGKLWAAAEDGFVFCLNERDGKLLWRLSTGEPIGEPPVLIEDSLYVVTRFGGMYRVKADSGDIVWRTRGPTKFIAASAKRVYTRDALGQLVYLDKESGARLGQLDIAAFHFQITNSETDRIYLADKSGLIQCLREIDLEQPLYHVPIVTEIEKPESPQEEPAAAEEPAPPPPPAEDIDDPFR